MEYSSGFRAPIPLSRPALTAECTYGGRAEKPIRIHVRGSYDGLKYDTTDLYSFDNDLRFGGKARKTVELEPKVGFIKVFVRNMDQSEKVSDIKVTVTLGG